MKPTNKGPVRRLRLRAVVAYPAVTVALVASMALVLTPLGAAQGLTVAVLPTPTETTTVTTAPPAPVPTTAEPTTVSTTAASTLIPTTLAPAPAATTAAGPVPNPTPGVDPSLAPALAVAAAEHHVLAAIGETDFVATYLAVDAPALDGSQFQAFRVRFRLHNEGTGPVTLAPRLEYRADGAAAFAVVPETPQIGSPLHVAREWVPSIGGGTKQGPLEEAIAALDFKLPLEVGLAVPGHHSMGANPDVPMILPGASYTEQEFTVQLSLDAKFLTGYELRVTDGGTALTGTQVARIVVGPQPELQLSPGQRQGIVVDDPAAANAAGVVYPLLAAPTAPDPTSATATPASEPEGAPLYALASGSLSPAVVTSVEYPVVERPGMHGQCAACHRGHTAKGPNLTKESQQSTLCLGCHNAAGTLLGAKDVEAQYPITLPVNVPANREYYSHDALTPTTPATEGSRQSGCSACHNSHKAGSTDSTQTAGGWDASGRLAGVAGVSVDNSQAAAGEAPAYTFLSGLDTNVEPANLVTLEYQLCFKCHSGYTELLPKIAGKPSKDSLDKAVEFNPANPSFHPVEAAGKNQTDKMTASLEGTSPYKLWNFNTTSTIRCVNCHASNTTPGSNPVEPAPSAPPVPAPGSAGLPQPGSSLPSHTSSNRGILLRNYKDRVLKPSDDVVVGGVTVDKAAYNAGDFALCYVCHAEEPFRNQTANKTNFPLHGKHLTGIAGRSNGGTDIDTAGAGQGNAICAECHFRIHSTTFKEGTQDIPGSRLVSFSPNVTSYQRWNGAATRSWTLGATADDASCTLTCHGKEHDKAGYSGRQH